MFNKPLIYTFKCTQVLENDYYSNIKQSLFNNYEGQTLNSKLINFIRSKRQ